MSLRDDSGDWVDDPDSLKNIVRSFYANLFKEDTPIRDYIVSWTTYPNVVEEQHERLNATIQLIECKRALFDMSPHKAPGEDGYPAVFFSSVGIPLLIPYLNLSTRFGLIILLSLLLIILCL